jgi:hypothetical protein
MFVDDLMGACHRFQLGLCLSTAKEVVASLLGPAELTVADRKTLSGRTLDFIGWSLDLDLQRLGIARHNYLKVLYGFLEIEGEGSYVTMKTLERLGSWVSRYTLVCRFLKPFSRVIYDAYAGYRNQEARIQVSSDLWTVIQLWRLFLILMEVNPVQYTRAFKTFQVESSTIFANIDACLQGVGNIVLPLPTSAQNIPGVLYVLGYKTPYPGVGVDSGYQNSMEFIAVVILLALLASHGYRDQSIILQGDNTTSLAWCALEKFRSKRCLVAAIAYIRLSMASGLVFSETRHLAGIHMTYWSDPLSRGVSPESLGYPAPSIRHVEQNPALKRFIDLMDPSVAFDLADDLGPRWAEFDSLIGIFLSPTGGWM